MNRKSLLMDLNTVVGGHAIFLRIAELLEYKFMPDMAFYELGKECTREEINKLKRSLESLSIMMSKVSSYTSSSSDIKI